MILKDERAGLEHRLGEGGARLGRDPDLDIIFPEHEDVVSAIHCRVILKNGEWWLEDLGSTNGTWLEGKRITGPVRLSTGQRFSLGQRGPVLKASIAGQVARTMAEPAEAIAGGPLVRLRRLKGGDDLVGAGTEVVLGRASACTIPLRTVADTVVSKRHAMIAVDEKGTAAVLDLGSRNGTFLNGKPVKTRTAIGLGDRLMLGWEGPLFEVRALGPLVMDEGAGAPYRPRGGPAKTLSGMMAVAEEQARAAKGMRTGVFVGALARQLATESSLAFRLATLFILLALAGAVVLVARTASERTARAEEQLNAEHAVTTQLLAEQQKAQGEIAQLESSLKAARRAAVSRAVLDSLERRLREAEAAAAAPLAPAPGGTPHDFTEVARDNSGAVGLVVSRFPAGDSVMGSGFAITSSGVFVTNRHVVLDDTRGSASSISVVMAETNAPLAADVVVTSTILGQDIAILRIRGYSGPVVRAIDWAGHGATQGAPAVVIGFPFGTQLALTPGGYIHASLFGGYISQSTGEWIRFSGSTYAGVSGSPVFNAQGEVIAVHFGAPREPGLGIGVPMMKVRRWLPPQAKMELGL